MGSYAVYDSCRCVKARHCADGGTRAEVAGCLTRVVVLPGLGMAMKRWGSARSAEGGCITDYGLFGAGQFLVWSSGVGVLQSTLCMWRFLKELRIGFVFPVVVQ